MLDAGGKGMGAVLHDVTPDDPTAAGLNSTQVGVQAPPAPQDAARRAARESERVLLVLVVWSTSRVVLTPWRGCHSDLGSDPHATLRPAGARRLASHLGG